MAELIQAARGTKDILPQDQPYWRFIEKAVEKKLEQMGFGRIETPIFEYPNIFLRSLGSSTDIVQKEMFKVERYGGKVNDDDKAQYILRPENTAGVVRAYLENGMSNWPQPVKLWYFGPMFRYDRPQKGRMRQFWQWGFEIFGDDDAATDAMTVMAAWTIFEALKLSKNLVVELNTLGCKTCRPKIRKTLTSYFEKYQSRLSTDAKRQLKTNPLRILDSKNPEDQDIINGAPQIIDAVCDDCSKNFRYVLEYLDDIGIPYDLNPRLVRGLDYYNGTTFEIRDREDLTRQSSLGGGGRYDELVVQLGGKPTPGVGFAAGVERIIELLKEKQVKVPIQAGPQITLIQLGQTARRQALKIIKTVTELGYRVDVAFGKDSLKGQLRQADKLGSRLALIIGQREAFDNAVIVKDLRDSSQETVKTDRLEKVLNKKLRK